MLLVHRMHLEQQNPRAGWAEFSCKGPGSPFPGFVGLMVSAQKNIYFCFVDYTKAFDCVDHNKLENLKRWEYQTTLPVSRETCMQVKKQKFELDMEQLPGSKVVKEYDKAVYCHPAY